MLPKLSNRRTIISIALLLCVVIFVFFLLSNSSLEAEYVKIFESNNAEIVKELSEHNFRFIIKNDGSVWIHEDDQYKYAMCCT
ncbi:hypothetical protein [Brevibacillus brevis]|uniref:hypothetical protein n=1 Tax=Brevibacillus brevis TaxID=1393 RepID=UPI000D0F0765|nr:hypothetical protein [Brevibacillus brevis]PSJ67994.1 hypothetical protein C7J99_16340 [Brevibacillus brevis]RED35461.1 hypothetical protein DES34_101118 [Brevibacillus brevis]GEC87875.1 hypothetical protein BBR01nite_02060 [Brevibacillus brevis]VEF89429.1 Uncharacterised protein [Brevibacillus brevis]